MNKGLLVAILFVVVAVVLKLTVQTNKPSEPVTLDQEVNEVVTDMESLQSEHMQAETWEDVESANQKLESFNQKAKSEAAAFLNLPHIASATGDLALYRKLFKEEFEVLDVTEPRRLMIEARAREFESMDITKFAQEQPAEYLAKVGEFCQMIRQQREDTLKHLDYGKQRKTMLEDPGFFKQVFLDKLTYDAGMEAMQKIVSSREVVYQSWENTYQASECERVLAAGG